jgi:hypothetical protein
MTRDFAIFAAFCFQKLTHFSLSNCEK